MKARRVWNGREKSAALTWTAQGIAQLPICCLRQTEQRSRHPSRRHLVVLEGDNGALGRNRTQVGRIVCQERRGCPSAISWMSWMPASSLIGFSPKPRREAVPSQVIPTWRGRSPTRHSPKLRVSHSSDLESTDAVCDKILGANFALAIEESGSLGGAQAGASDDLLQVDPGWRSRRSSMTGHPERGEPKELREIVGAIGGATSIPSCRKLARVSGRRALGLETLLDQVEPTSRTDARP